MILDLKSVQRLMMAIACCLLLTNCKSKFEKVLASNDPAYKYRQATYYYNMAKEKNSPRYFENARLLLEELRTSYAGNEKIEDIYYYLAYCYFGLGDLEQARFYFKNLADTYPNSEHSEDARFQVAYCYYQDSPIYSLDQGETYKAMEAFQLFLTLYPTSEKIDDSHMYMDELRAKLEKKSFENAKIYYTIGYYPAAVVALQNSVRDYPDTEFRQEIDFLILKSHYLYAKNSFQNKKEERYNKTLLTYKSFIEQYPESTYKKEVEEIHEETQEALDDLSTKSTVTAKNIK